MFEISAVETMLRFVAGGVGVSIVPSGLARAWAPTLKLSVLPFRAQKFHMPKWKARYTNALSTPETTREDGSGPHAWSAYGGFK